MTSELRSKLKVSFNFSLLISWSRVLVVFCSMRENRYVAQSTEDHHHHHIQQNIITSLSSKLAKTWVTTKIYIFVLFIFLLSASLSWMFTVIFSPSHEDLLPIIYKYCFLWNFFIHMSMSCDTLKRRTESRLSSD